MREWILILAALARYAAAQPTFPSPPPELDQQVMANPPRVGDRAVASVPVQAFAIEAAYPHEARIAGLGGRVVLDGSHVLEPLGLGLDDAALDAARRSAVGADALRPHHLHADFLLPEKNSRWHLLSVVFISPEGAARPAFVSTTYPLGAGLIGGQAIDYAQSVAATRRQVLLALTFDIDERGMPSHFAALYATGDLWFAQATAFLTQWRFKPALLMEKPVAARCVIGLTWAAKIMTGDQLAERATLIRATATLR